MTNSQQIEIRTVWGVLVCICIALPFINGLGFLATFTLIFGDFLEKFMVEKKAMTYLMSTYLSSFSLSSAFSTKLAQSCGLKFTIIVGVLLYSFGSILQIYVVNVETLLIAFSCVQGIGFGLIVPVLCAMFSRFFQKNRVVWISLVQLLIGIGGIGFPYMINAIQTHYNFYIGLCIMMLINLTGLLGIVGLQFMYYYLQEISKNQSNDVVPDEIQENLPISILEFGNWTGSIILHDATPEIVRTCNAASSDVDSESGSKSNRLIAYLDLSLLFDPLYLIIVVGVTVTVYADILFFALQPLYLNDINYDKIEIVSVIAACSIADFISRIIQGILSQYFKMPARYIFALGCIFITFMRCEYMDMCLFRHLVKINFAMCIFRSLIYIQIPLIFAEYLTKRRFSVGYRTFVFLYSIIILCMGPIISFLHEYSGETDRALVISNILMGVCPVLWCFDIIYKHFYRKTVFTECISF